VDVSARDLEKIPARNLRVPVVDFAELWIAAERQLDADPRSWATFGVVETCRWLAGATVPRITGGWQLAKAPVTERTGIPYEEVIAAECLAAEKLLFRRPVPTWIQNQPGWLPAVVATLAWAWRRTGPPPIDIHSHARA
jgi:hypothetical protein